MEQQVAAPSEAIGLFVAGYAIACLVLALVFVFARNRIGTARAAAWLVVLGVALLAAEEALFALWLCIATPAVDHSDFSFPVPVARRPFRALPDRMGTRAESACRIPSRISS
jgi:hypothetical protein